MSRAWRIVMLALLAVAAVSPSSAQGAAEAPPVIPAEIAFVVGADGVESAEGASFYPGELVGIAIEWATDEARPESPSLEVDRDAQRADQPRPRRIVRADPRAQGRDVVEVLLTGVGEVEIPALTIGDSSGNVVAETAPISLTISPKLVEGQEPAPERGARSIGLDRLGIALVAAVALLALILAAGLAWFLARREKRPPPSKPVPVVPKEPADVIALRELDELLASGLLERDELKPFGIRLTEIGKAYFGALGQIPLRERTTHECERLLKTAGLPFSRINWLTEWLERIDLVKFAGDRPAGDVMRDLAASLRAQVEKTRDELHRSDEPRHRVVAS